MDNVQNNLDLNSELTEDKESLNSQPENESTSPEVIENNNTNGNNFDSSISDLDSMINEQKIKDNLDQETVEIETEDTTQNVETESMSSDEVNLTDETTIVNLKEEIANLQVELEKQTEENNLNKSQYMRIVADFENFRRRTAKEKEELEQQIKKKTISELLSVVDNFERARNQIKPANEGELTIHKSYQGVYKNLVDSLKKIGVSAMRPEGEAFDPIYHEAMLREPTNEYPEGIVIEQLVRGYLLNDDVLRHAMVKVAAPMEDDTAKDSHSAQESSVTETN